MRYFSRLKQWLRQNPYGFAAFLTFVGYLVVVLRAAWVSDDAYITLRTVDNFVNGNGLTWNIGERVQTYTHPLWMFLLSIPYLFTREAFYTTIATSVSASALAVLIAAGGIKKSAALPFFFGLCFLSRAFVDYSTSGLEQPLTYLLLSLFLRLIHTEPRTRRHDFLAMAVACAAALNRADRIGAIVVGHDADLLILDIPNVDRWAYHVGVNPVRTVLKRGEIVWEN